MYHVMGQKFSSLEGVRDNVQKLLNRWNLVFAPALLKLAEEIGKEDIPEWNQNGMFCCMYICITLRNRSLMFFVC